MMQNRRNILNGYRLCWTACISVLFLLIAGYTFNGGDQEEHLPYVYRLLNPSLYPDDYLVSYQVNHFTVRYYYAHLVAFFANWLPVTSIVLVFHLLSIMVFSWATGSLAAKISRSETAFILAPFLSIILFNEWTTGGNVILDNQFICTVPAMALGAIALRLAYERKFMAMAFFSGLACLFQVLTGLQLFMILLVVCFIVYRGSFRYKEGLKTIAVFLLASGPMLLPVLYQQFFSGENYDRKLYSFILFEFRNAHHYLPSRFPATDYLKTILITGLSVLIFLLGFFRDYRRFYTWFAGFIVVGSLLYYVGFERMGIAAIGKLQWFKSTVWLTWAGCITLAAYLSSFRISMRVEERLQAYGTVLPLSVTLVFVLFMNNAGEIKKEWSGRYQFSGEMKTDQQRMHAWINEYTSTESIFLIPPGDDRFLCEAKRSVPVAWKGIIHAPWFLIPWYQNLEKVAGSLPQVGDIPGQLDKAYRMQPDSLIRFPKTIHYRLIDAGIAGPPIADSLIVHREGNYVLLYFRP